MENKDILNNFLLLNNGEMNDFIYQLEKNFNISSKDLLSESNNIIISETAESDKDKITKNFSIKLCSYLEEKKFSVMKTIKALFSLTLKETTEILNNLPFILKKTNSETEALKIKQEIEEMGGTVVIE